ncbi:MAG: hypothetical protein ACLFN4_07890, partial [Candidatus Acetothermia bacterium]
SHLAAFANILFTSRDGLHNDGRLNDPVFSKKICFPSPWLMSGRGNGDPTFLRAARSGKA